MNIESTGDIRMSTKDGSKQTSGQIKNQGQNSSTFCKTPPTRSYHPKSTSTAKTTIDLTQSSSPDTGTHRAPKQAKMTDTGGEFWAVLGPDWSEEKVAAFAAKSSEGRLLKLLAQPPLRPLVFDSAFIESCPSLKLTFKHLYGALVYTRGKLEHEIPCAACAEPGELIFEKCVSSDMAHGACASHLWTKTAGDCDHHKGPTKNRVQYESSPLSSDNEVSVPRGRRRQSTRAATTQKSRENSPNVTTRRRYQEQVKSQVFTTIPKAIPKAPALRKTGRRSNIDELIPTTQDFKGNVASRYAPYAAVGAIRPVAQVIGPQLGDNLFPNLRRGRLVQPSNSYNAQFIDSMESPSVPAIVQSKSRRPSTMHSSLSRKREISYGGYSSDEPLTQRPRFNSPVANIYQSPIENSTFWTNGRDSTLCSPVATQQDTSFLSGDFEYGNTEKAIVLTVAMVEEARSKNRIQVGPHLLNRFAVEMDSMWAMRIAAARASHKEQQ